jgi:hypothetical protein
MANKKLSATITIGGVVSGTLNKAIGSATKGLTGLSKEVDALKKKESLLTAATRQMGNELMRARRAKDEDKASITRLTDSYSRLQTQLANTRRAQQQLIATQARAARSGAIATKAMGAGKTAALSVGAGVAASAAVAKPLIGAAIERENVINLIHNSGVSKEDGDSMVKAAQDAKQFGVSTTKATETIGELRTALGDTHHALEALPISLKAISGLQLYDRMHKTELAGGDSAFQLAKIAEERGGAASPEALQRKYNWAFKALTGSNGKVSVDDLLTSVRGGKGAVAGMSDEAFFGDTFLMQAMGAPGYAKASSTLNQAWIGGHQQHGAFEHMMQLGLLNKSGVKFDKTGKVKTVGSDALIDSKLLISDPQKWVDKNLIPILEKKGINVDDEDSVPAIQQFVNSITSNSNAASLLLNRIRFHKNVWKDRNNVNIAHDAEQSDKANQESSAGKEANARARLEDAEARMGDVLLPKFASAMTSLADILEKLNDTAEGSPRLFKAFTWGIIGITGAVAGLTVAGVVAGGVTSVATALGMTALGLGGTLLAVLGPIGLVVGAVGALAYAWRDLTQKEIDAVKDHGGAKLTAGAQARVNAGELNPKALPEYQLPANLQPSARSLMAGGGRGGDYGANTTIHVGGITINAPAETDHNKLAHAVGEEFSRRVAVQRRGQMFDGVSH